MIAIIFDTETTGLMLPSAAELSKQPRIIELGAVITDGKSILKKLSQLIDPGVPVSAEITKITGITNTELAGQPSFKKFLPALKEFFAGSDFLIAHNAPFDSGMLANELKLAECEDFPWPAETVCTAQEYTAFMGYRASMKDVYEKIMGMELKQAHRALDDVIALAEMTMQDDFFTKIGAL